MNFFDAVLERLKSDCRVDAKRIYSTGQSNGGGSTYLLWAVPGDIFAALAPSSAASAGSAGKRPWLKPVPVMHITGEADSLVKYHWQVAAMNADRKLKGCQAVAKPRHGHRRRLLYESPTGAPFVSVIDPGGHKFFDEAPALIVAFFKEH